jgi:uncharacterized membrane protein YcjF (UPF0283 family)
MPDDNTLTDRSYAMVEMVERRRKLLTTIVIACFILAPVGIGINAHIYQVASHQKGDWSNTDIALMGIISAISALLFAIGIEKYIVIRDLKSKLAQLQLLEETIYNEVLKPNMRQLE